MPISVLQPSGGAQEKGEKRHRSRVVSHQSAQADGPRSHENGFGRFGYSYQRTLLVVLCLTVLCKRPKIMIADVDLQQHPSHEVQIFFAHVLEALADVMLTYATSE
eukprot:scaffold27287_cov38-Phaeocystis_antarctica.AAC.3